jgi:hypothetical protein
MLSWVEDIPLADPLGCIEPEGPAAKAAPLRLKATIEVASINRFNDIIPPSQHDNKCCSGKTSVERIGCRRARNCHDRAESPCRPLHASKVSSGPMTWSSFWPSEHGDPAFAAEAAVSAE